MPFDIGQALQQFPLVTGNQGPQTYAVPPSMMEANPAPMEKQQPLGVKQRIGALFQDPDFNQSLMAFGANLMRSPQRGENLGDVFGSSLLAGMNTYQGLKGKKAAGAADEAKMQKDDQRQAGRDQLAQDQLQLSREELQARKDADKARNANEAADRTSRENVAKLTAARAGSGGGTSAIEFAFGEAKKAYVASGMPESEAQQRATKDVILSQKTPSEGSLAQQRYNRAVDIATDAWMRNPESLMANPQQAAAQIHQMAVQLARSAMAASGEFEGSAPAPGGGPAPATPPAPGAPGATPATPASASGVAPQAGSTGPSPITLPAPAAPGSGVRKPQGRGTQSAPYSAQEAQAAANAQRKPIKAWVVNPTGQPQQVTITPDNAAPTK